MSMSKNTLKYILMFLGIVILLAAYVFVYLDYSGKTDTLTAEIASLNSRLDQLKSYEDKIPQYQKGIEENKNVVNNALNKYYSMDTPEDFIMFATDMENTIGLKITALSFTEPELIYTIAGIKDTEDYKRPAEPLTLTGYKISSTFDGSMKYSQMKAALDFINAQPDVTRLDSMTVNYDSSTGLIMGNFIIDKYFITGRDIEEHQANVPYNDLGKSALIGN